MTPPPVVDCLVVGAGPAGLTAALYLQRYHRSVLLVDHGRSRALGIHRSHNVPGFPQGIAGAELLERMRGQLAACGGEVTTAEVTALARREDGVFVAAFAPPAPPVAALTVLLATGVVDRVPPLRGVEAVQSAGLLRQCPICDGHEHRGRRIAVVGDGPHAAREARFIAHYSDHVALVGVEGGAAAPEPAGSSRVRALESPALAVESLPDGGLRLLLADGGAHDCDVIYAAMGVRPRSGLAAALGAELDELGSIRVDSHGRTGVPGLFAAGDVASGLDQIAVAAGQGAVVATAVHNGLPATGPRDAPVGTCVAAAGRTANAADTADLATGTPP